MSEKDIQNRAIARRRLLRRAGSVAAGVAGAGVVAAVAAEPAMAASGSFDSNSTSAPAITGDNTVSATENIGGSVVPVAGPVLRIVPQENTDIISSSAPPGSFAIDNWGTLWTMVSPDGAGPYRNFVYDSFNATQTWPITPVRVLDTRGIGVGHSNVLGGVTSADFNLSTGRLRANRWIHIDLSDHVQWGYAVLGTLQVAVPLSGGHMAAVPYGSVDYNVPPETSNLLFGGGVYIQNMLFCGIGGGGAAPSTDIISLWSAAETHVILDVMGFVVDSIGRIAEYNSGGGGAGLRAQSSFMAQRRAEINSQGH